MAAAAAGVFVYHPRAQSDGDVEVSDLPEIIVRAEEEDRRRARGASPGAAHSP